MSQHFRVKVVSKTTAPRPLDGPQQKRSRASRPGQQAPFNVPGQARRRGERDDNEDERAPSGFLGWGDRQGRKRDHWEARLGPDVDAFLASLPGRAAQQRQERQQQLQQRQAQLASMEPLPCHLAAENGSCCELHKTGSQAAVFYGPLGVVGRLTLPVWECKTHGRPNITVHPLQISCVPTAPVNNTKLLDVELVRQFRLLQLPNGVGAHGKSIASCGALARPPLLPATVALRSFLCRCQVYSCCFHVCCGALMSISAPSKGGYCLTVG